MAEKWWREKTRPFLLPLLTLSTPFHSSPHYPLSYLPTKEIKDKAKNEPLSTPGNNGRKLLNSTTALQQHFSPHITTFHSKQSFLERFDLPLGTSHELPRKARARFGTEHAQPCPSSAALDLKGRWHLLVLIGTGSDVTRGEPSAAGTCASPATSSWKYRLVTARSFPLFFHPKRGRGFNAMNNSNKVDNSMVHEESRDEWGISVKLLCWVSRGPSSSISP